MPMEEYGELVINKPILYLFSKAFIRSEMLGFPLVGTLVEPIDEVVGPVVKYSPDTVVEILVRSVVVDMPEQANIRAIIKPNKRISVFLCKIYHLLMFHWSFGY